MKHKLRRAVSAFLLSSCLAVSVSALPVQIEQGETLKVSSQGETLFEVDPLTDESLNRLRAWLENPPEKVGISSDQGVIKGLPMDLVVTAAIAAKWKSERKTLAQLFTERLNSVLGDTQPKWSVSSQIVPLNESRAIQIRPFPSKAGLSVISSDPEVLKVEDLGNGSYRLTGRKWGRASLSASSSQGMNLSELPVSVKPWAARFGEGPGTLTFWGPASQPLVERTLRRWLSARTLIGGQVELTRQESKTGDLSYKAQATAPGAITVESVFPIKISEYEKQYFQPAELVVLSNHPERIVSDGILFQRTVESTPLRFMWHHRNDPEGPDRYLVLQLANPTGKQRRMRMLWYGYGPSPDEIHVGHTAALDYSSAGMQGLGEELLLPANGTRTMEIRRVKAGQTMSGMAYLSDLTESAGPLEITVLATNSPELPTVEAAIQDKGRTASGVFVANIEADASHILGGPFTYLEFGNEPYVKDLSKGHPSYGNFGTVYRTRLLLKNPSNVSKEAFVGFASGGGAARGVLALDGELFDLPMGLTGNGVPVKKFLLEPGEVRQVDVELFPQAGSNYPVRVVVRSEFERLEKENVEPLRPLRKTIP